MPKQRKSKKLRKAAAGLRRKLRVIDNKLAQADAAVESARTAEQPQPNIDAADRRLAEARETMAAVRSGIGDIWTVATPTEKDGILEAIRADLSRGISSNFRKHGELEDHTVEGLVEYINLQLDRLQLPPDIRQALNGRIQGFAEEKMKQLKAGHTGLLYPDLVQENLNRRMHEVMLTEATKPVLAASYRLPPNYWPWARLREHFLACAISAAGLDTHTIPHVKESCQMLQKYDYPFYLVGANFLEELAHTRALDSLNLLTEAPLPFPAFILLFPRGSLLLTFPDGVRDVAILRVSMLPDQQGLLFACQEFAESSGFSGREFSTTLGIRDDGSLIDAVDEVEVVRRGNHALPATVNDDVAIQVTLQLGKLVSKVLAAMAAEPKLVDAERIERVRPAKKGKKRLEFRDPRKLGWRVAHRNYGKSEKTGDGHAISPHWREGFSRRQHHGPKNSLTKIVRHPPVRVNSHLETS
jgi:hypothetical protein